MSERLEGGRRRERCAESPRARGTRKRRRCREGGADYRATGEMQSKGYSGAIRPPPLTGRHSRYFYSTRRPQREVGREEGPNAQRPSQFIKKSNPRIIPTSWTLRRKDGSQKQLNTEISQSRGFPLTGLISQSQSHRWFSVSRFDNYVSDLKLMKIILL